MKAASSPNLRPVTRPRGIFIVEPNPFGMAYGAEERACIAGLVDIVGESYTRAQLKLDPRPLRDVDFIFSSWGMPIVDDAFLDLAPNLKVIFYAAGSISAFATDALWRRGVQITTATSANAVPVAEYTLGTILLSLKHFWRLSQTTRVKRAFANKSAPGAFKRNVGLISLGEIGRLVAERLRHFDLNVFAYDPFFDAATAKSLGVEMMSLESIFERCDVVSLHSPLLTETVGMLRGEHFASMKSGATFINTARGAIVREEEMLDVMERRPDLQAILDVCEPQPPRPDSRIFTLPNVILTPHVAGSIGQECERMGRYMCEELSRYLRGEPLKWAVEPTAVERSAHRPVVSVSIHAPAKPNAKRAKTGV